MYPVKSIKRNASSLAFILLASCFGTAVSAQSWEDWELSDKGATIIEKDNQSVLRFERGSATLSDSKFADGTIEFELFTSGERAFVHVHFRQQSDQQSEVVYFRTHKSNAPDTIQYAPVYQGMSAWQLYPGEKGSASTPLPANAWIKIKLEVIGQNLSVWAGDETKPVMENVRLTGSGNSGVIRLRGFVPGASKATYSGMIRNVQITHSQANRYETTEKAPLPDNVLTAFSFSSAFESEKIPVHALPQAIETGSWQTVEPDNQGVYELLRSITVPDSFRRWAAAGDIVLTSQSAQMCTLHLGYSDTVTLHLNQQPLVFSDASYRYVGNRQEGIFHDKQLTVYLPLNQGDNHLRAIIGDSFGGWGFTASLSECSGVTQKRSDKTS